MYYKKNYIFHEIIRIFFKHNIKIPLDFIRDVFDNYEDLPFHNIVHAFEVFNMTHKLVNIVQKKRKIFDKCDITALLISALCHDINHKGKTNITLKTESLSNLDNLFTIDEYECFDMKTTMISRNHSYDNIQDIESFESFNEETHIEHTLFIVKFYKNELFPKKTPWDKIEQLITSFILCTDLSLHNKYVNQFNINNKYSIGNLIIKLADISHPLQPFGIHSYWTLKIKEEQDTFNDFKSIKEISQDTLMFINMFLNPLMILFNQYFEITTYMNTLKTNINIWKSYMI
jgi:hypothetical protein